MDELHLTKRHVKEKRKMPIKIETNKNGKAS